MTAEAIIFAINSAIRLGRNAQRAYSLSLSSKAIVLPLPKFSGTPNAFTAQRFFDSEEADGGARFIARMERLQAIHQRFKSAAGADFPTDEELEKYVESFVSLSALQAQEANPDFKDGLNDNRINSDELVALLSIRQYTYAGAKHTSPLQLVAGTIVEIGIDYFNKIPGALNQQSATGRTLQHFLRAFDDLPLSDNARLQAQSRKIVPQLFIAAAETLTDFSNHLINDPKIQSFVQAAGSGIAQDLNTRLLEIADDDHQDEAINWGRFLLRSTIANSGHYVFAAPGQFFKTNSGASALITATSTVLLDAILKDPDQLQIKAGLNAETLDRLLRSSFTVLAEHPQLIHHNNGFQEVVTGVSSALKDYNFRRPDLFPELVRLVLENTGKNLHLFWQNEADDDHSPHQAREAQGLLIQTVQLILQELSQPVDAGNWRPHLSKSQLLTVTEELLDKVVSSPDWVTREVGGKPLLAAVVRATVDGLANIPRDERLSAHSFLQLLELNLRTVATNELVLQKIKWSAGEPEKAVLQQALSLVFAFTFDRQRTTTGDRYTLLTDLLDYVLDVIISRHPDHRGLQLVDLILASGLQLDDAGGFNRRLANSLLDAALDALATHPTLISKDKALGEIVAGVASALNASSFKDSHILAELVRLSLEATARNAQLLVHTAPGKASFLVVLALQDLLTQLSTQKTNGRWRPQLTDGQLLVVVEKVLERIVARPDWAGPNKLIQVTLQAIYTALGELRSDQPLPFETFSLLIQAGLDAVGQRQALVLHIVTAAGGRQQLVLEYALGSLLVELYDTQHGTAGSWTLTNAETLRTLLSHYLLRLAVGPADQQTVDAIRQPIGEAIQRINNNLAFSLEELLGKIGEA